MEKIYLACPYSHQDAKVRNQRYQAVNKIAAMLMERNFVVFSPLSHTIAIDKYLPETDWKFWKRQDFPMIDWCDTLVVLCIDGWESSVGIKEETEYAKEKKKHIVYFHPHEKFLELWND